MATILSRLMKKAVIPLANRSTCPHGTHTSAISIISNSTTNLFPQVLPTTSIIPAHHHFCAIAYKRSDTTTDDTLLSRVESEIDDGGEIFRKFSFKIADDNASEGSITLTREYQGEEIIVEAEKRSHHYNVVEHKSEKRESHYFHLDISVSKKSGQTLEFHVTSDADVITIDSLDLQYPNDTKYFDKPEFSELDKNLQKDFVTYLEVRGIGPSINKFLYEYMDENKHRNYFPNK